MTKKLSPISTSPTTNKTKKSSSVTTSSSSNDKVTGTSTTDKKIPVKPPNTSSKSPVMSSSNNNKTMTSSNNNKSPVMSSKNENKIPVTSTNQLSNKTPVPLNLTSNKIPVKNSDKYVTVLIDRSKRAKGPVGSPSYLRLQAESEYPPVEEGVVTIDTSKCRSTLEVVRKSVKDLGWKEFAYGRKENHCDVYWNALNFNESPDVTQGKISKYPGTNEIFTKTNLFRCLDIMKGLFPCEFDFYPRTWFLPQQYYQFSAAVKYMTDKKIRPRPTFIVKPSEGAQGDGIYLLRDPTNYQHGNKNHVVQDYLSNILLIDDFKFDFRIYAVLTSIEPLEIHICDEGLARFSTIPYEHPNAKNIHETYMHLTNYSLNKRSENFDKSDKEDAGSKRKVTQVLKLLKRNGHDTEAVWYEIEQIVCKTILAVLGELKVEYNCALSGERPDVSCFQILGFDIILLKNLKPMLLEVNSTPSLRIDSETEVSPGVMQYALSTKDQEIKRPLIRDTLTLIAPKHKFTKKRRRKKKIRVVKTPEPTNQPTALVIMSETKDITERLLTFNMADHNALNSSSPSSQSDLSANTTNQNQSNESTNNAKNMHNKSANHNNRNEDLSSNRKSREKLSVNSNSESDSGKESSVSSSEATNESSDSDEPTNEMEEENEGAESEEDEEEEEEEEEEEVEREPSCLKEIYPNLYGADYKHLHLLERMADMFIPCLGVCTRSSKLSSSGFRLFTRKCKLNGKGLSNATIDLIYIDMHRKHVTPERGMTFGGFVDACHDLARRKFKTNDRLDMMSNFLDYCQENIDAFNAKQAQEEEEKRTPLARKQKSRSHIYPQLTASVLGESTLHELYGQSLRKEYLDKQHKKINAYMAANHKRTYQARTRITLKHNQGDP